MWRLPARDYQVVQQYRVRVEFMLRLCELFRVSRVRVSFSVSIIIIMLYCTLCNSHSPGSVAVVLGYYSVSVRCFSCI